MLQFIVPIFPISRQITDNTLSHLVMGCPKLEKLSLSHCELITDDGIRHLGLSASSSEYLQYLELDNCPLITDMSLEHLIGCHNLKRVELYDCQLITRAGIRRLRVRIVAPTSMLSKLSDRRWLIVLVIVISEPPSGCASASVLCSSDATPFRGWWQASLLSLLRHLVTSPAVLLLLPLLPLHRRRLTHNQPTPSAANSFNLSSRFSSPFSSVSGLLVFSQNAKEDGDMLNLRC